MATVDLHFHSTASDGMLTVPELFERAAEKGATLLALTDHDCTDNLLEARGAARARGIGFLDGVEISVTWKEQHTVHVVGLGIDAEHPLIVAGLQRIRKHRLQRAREMAQALAREGMDGVFDGALALCSNKEMIGRMHFARYLVKSGYVKDIRSVFRRFLTPGKPGFVAQHWASLSEAIEWIRSAGGTAVLAHPARYVLNPNTLDSLLSEFKVLGGEALEVVSGTPSLDEIYKYALLAQRYGLWSSVGSDFHGPCEGKSEIGQTKELPPICRPVWIKLADRVHL